MLQRVIKFLRYRMMSCEEYARYKGVKVGKGCLISTKNFPSESYLVSIGDYCRIAKGVSFFTHGGLWSQRKKYNDLEHFGKIYVGNYTYIGEDALIMPGVTIGNDVIIGAGSVVTKSIPDGKIAAGNPARIVGDTIEFVERTRSVSLPTFGMTYEQKKSYLLSLDDSAFIKK
jgi:acetyltransferase-like isoleucine patch superfamily enzyme